MHPVLNHLIQLQELTLIRDEQKVAGGTHLQQLDESISGMTKELPEDIRVLFGKLHKKDHIVIVPVSNGICAACGMQLPISQVQAVRQAVRIRGCPNCARFLYFPEVAARRLTRVSGRAAPMKAGISRFSSASLMIPRLQSSDKEGVIHEMASKMEEEGFIDKAEHLAEAALRREAIVSTVVEHGLAFPHVRSVEGGGLTLALGIHRKGIRFDGPQKKLTRIFFFIAIPTAASAFYLKLLSGLTETFVSAAARSTLMAQKTPAELWKALFKVTRVRIK